MNVKITIHLFFILSLFVHTATLNAKIAILGCDSSGSDEFNFVSDEAIAAGTVIYFSEEEYDSANNQFDVIEGTISYTVPAGGLPAGRVVVILDQNSGGISADDGGAVVIVAGNWALSGTEEEITAFTASNPASPWNTVTSVFCWFILEGGAGVGSNEDPSTNYPSCIVQDWTAQFDRAQYIRDRSLATTLTDIQTASNWSFGSATTTMNSTDFTGTFTLDLALPVELSSFKATAKEEVVQLDWETQSELNNSGFEIEHSTNTMTWNRIHFIEGKGNSTLLNSYYFVDEKPSEGINYYRLKQLDYDGVFEYSEIVSVAFDSRNSLSELTIFPNPVTGNQINIILPEGGRGSVFSFQLFSVEGKIIKQWEQDFGGQILLEYNNVSNGIYFLKIRNGEGILQERLMISRK